MKYIPGITGQMSGSMGSMTASHNRYGSYLRQRVTPANPSSALQQLVRNIFLTLAGNWVNDLTSTQRDKWNLYGANVVMKDKMGQDQYITGMNHFIRSNSVIIRAAFPRVDPGPAILSLPGGDPTFAVTCSEATQLVSVAFDDTKAWASEDEAGMQILVSKPQLGSRVYITPTMKFGDMLEGDVATPLTSPQTFTCPWAIAETQIFMCEGRIVRADGRLSAHFRDNGVCAA